MTEHSGKGLYRGDVYPIGDRATVRQDRDENGCRWFSWLGGEGCDECGRHPSDHEGDLRAAPRSSLGDAVWEGRPYHNSTLPDLHSDAIAWVQHCASEADHG